MRFLPAFPKLPNDLVIDLILSLQKANQVGIGHASAQGALPNQAAEPVTATGSRSGGSSFSGLFTRVEIGHIRMHPKS
jgi:hypothetical protein